MPLLMALLAVFTFSLGDLVFRALGSAQVHFYTVLLASQLSLVLVAGTWLVARRQALFPPGFWGYPALLALFHVLNLVFSILTFQRLPVAVAYLVIFSYPLWVALLEAVITKRFPRRYAVSVLLGFLGVAIVFYGGSFSLSWGLLLALMCALAIAGRIIVARHMAEVSFTSLAFTNALVASVVAIIGLVLSGTVVSLGPTPLWLWLLLGVVSVVGPLALLYASQRMSSTRYALLGYLQIPIAVLLAAVFMAEPVSPRVAVGLCVIVAASLIAQISPRRKA